MLFNQTSINPSYVKVRWQEPYTSAALNNKSFGILPVGVYQGFTIQPGGLSGRDIVVGFGSVSGSVGTGLNSGYLSGDFDATVGFSIAVLQDPTGFQETVCIPPTGPQYHLDATGLEGQKVFIILTTTYGIGNATIASVALVDHSFIDANPWVCVLGNVSVPLNPATPLNSTNFAYQDVNYPRLTPLATPSKAGLMPPSVFGQIGQYASPWEQHLLIMDVDPNDPFVVTITPSQYVWNGKRIYSYVQASVASKFPRDVNGHYNGGPQNNQLTKMDITTGIIGGAQSVSGNSTFTIPSVSGTPNSWQVGLVALDGADNINVTYGGVYSSVTGATLDDNLPVAGAALLQVGAFVVGTDVSGHFLPLLSSVSGSVSGYGPILTRTPYLNVGGGGTGNANELLTRLQQRLASSLYYAVTDNIFAQSATAKIASATATYDVANNVYDFPSVGKNVVSIQALCTDFLALNLNVGVVEVWDFWSVVDTAHLVEVSRDGGFSFQAMTMVQIGTTDTFRGIYYFTEEASFATLATQANAGTSNPFNVSTALSQAQGITATAPTTFNQIQLTLNTIGSPLGSFRVQIVKDSGSSSPSLSPLDIVTQTLPIAITSLPSGTSTQVFTMPETIVPAGTYWIVLTPDIYYQASYVASTTELDVQAGTAGGLQARVFDGSAWSAAGNAWAYVVKGKLLDLRVRITSGTANVSLEGFGIFYGFSQPPVTGIKNIELQQFSGDDNINQFTVGTFIPDPDFLKVYFQGSGQVFSYGDFTLDGQIVTFPENSFNFPGETLTLKFDQTQGQGFDNSDFNGKLLADNHLGDPNPSFDRSVAGRGIFLRRPDGTLREITLDNNDRIAVWSV
jgi:hypothetical protein